MIAGLGALEAIGSAGEGTVIAVFTQAAYVRFPAGIAALTTAAVPPGPLHLSGGPDPSRLRGLRRFIVPEHWRRTATVWRGSLPGPDKTDPGLLGPLARRSALLTEEYWGKWRAAATACDLAIACQLLGGLGPGLTPSGDDALAGMLLGARLRWPAAEAYLVALAAAVDTHDISRAFLRWAARGQSIEPVHRLLARDGSAAADLLAFGATSGADLALGLRLGLTAPWRLPAATDDTAVGSR